MAWNKPRRNLDGLLRATACSQSAWFHARFWALWSVHIIWGCTPGSIHCVIGRYGALRPLILTILQHLPCCARRAFCVKTKYEPAHVFYQLLHDKEHSFTILLVQLPTFSISNSFWVGSLEAQANKLISFLVIPSHAHNVVPPFPIPELPLRE